MSSLQGEGRGFESLIQYQILNVGCGNAWGVRRTCNAKYRRVQIPHGPPSLIVPSATAIDTGTPSERRDGEWPLSHRGEISGVLEESGRPRNPVTVDTTGSNPVHTAKFGRVR